jgi:hypothetical protein
MDKLPVLILHKIFEVLGTTNDRAFINLAMTSKVFSIAARGPGIRLHTKLCHEIVNKSPDWESPTRVNEALIANVVMRTDVPLGEKDHIRTLIGPRDAKLVDAMTKIMCQFPRVVEAEIISLETPYSTRLIFPLMTSLEKITVREPGDHKSLYGSVLSSLLQTVKTIKTVKIESKFTPNINCIGELSSDSLECVAFDIGGFIKPDMEASIIHLISHCPNLSCVRLNGLGGISWSLWCLLISTPTIRELTLYNISMFGSPDDLEYVHKEITSPLKFLRICYSKEWHLPKVSRTWKFSNLETLGLINVGEDYNNGPGSAGLFLDQLVEHNAAAPHTIEVGPGKGLLKNTTQLPSVKALVAYSDEGKFQRKMTRRIRYKFPNLDLDNITHKKFSK